MTIATPYKRPHIALIGYGYWGKKLFRVFSNLGVEITVFDQQTAAFKEGVPGTHHRAASYEEILTNKAIDAVLIAVPTFSHFPLAQAALLHDKHIWIEKPMTTTSVEAETIVQIAAERQRIIYVDLTFLYTSAVQAIRQIVQSGELGTVQYITSSRTNFGLIQPDINVIYDLAVHDLSIIRYVLGVDLIDAAVQGVSCITKGTTKEKIEAASLWLRYTQNVTAHVEVSWLSPIKTRCMIFTGAKKSLVYNDLNEFKKVVIYDQRIVLNNELSVSYETHEETIVPLDRSEALTSAAIDFLGAINGTASVLTAGRDGAAVVALLEKLSVKN